jgi:hypothetical protein
LSKWLLFSAVFIGASSAYAETVDVKYRGPIDLQPFVCEAYTRSSFINRVCYDEANNYMLIKLNETWYHYCGIDAGTVDSLKSAESMGRYFNATIKGRFDCRSNAAPKY